MTTKRASLPRADELFRQTSVTKTEAQQAPAMGQEQEQEQDLEARETQSSPPVVAEPRNWRSPMETPEAAQTPDVSPVKAQVSPAPTETLPPPPPPQEISSPGTAPAPGGPALRVKTVQRSITKAIKTHVPRQGSGRQSHEEKVTFYCNRDELLALERGRLALREYGITVDRGRIVREALSIILDDLDRAGSDSILVDRLTRRA